MEGGYAIVQSFSQLFIIVPDLSSPLASSFKTFQTFLPARDQVYTQVGTSVLDNIK